MMDNSLSTLSRLLGYMLIIIIIIIIIIIQ